MSNNSKSSGVGIGTVLFLIFLVLKLCEVIDWSWWWVTSPLWISLGLWLVFGLPIIIYLKIETKKLNKQMSKTLYKWNWRKN